MTKNKIVVSNSDQSIVHTVIEPVKGKRGRKSKKELMAALNMNTVSVIGTSQSSPSNNENVVLVKGLFSETVKKTIGNDKISFMHIYCDTYNSTVDIFDSVTENVSNGCIIVFDELINYPNYHKHEYLALNEWVNKNNIEYEYIGINGVFYEDINIILDKKHQKAALRIIKNPKFTK